MTIYLLGTQHSAQVEWSDSNPSLKEKRGRFKAYVRHAAILRAVTAIGEEITPDSEESGGVILAKRVADELKIRHLACEPTKAERLLLKIPIDIEMPLGLPAEDWEAYRDHELQKHFPARENQWLRRLKPLLPGPILFICGGNHIPTFSSRLRDHGIPCEIICSNWWADDDDKNGELPIEFRPL